MAHKITTRTTVAQLRHWLVLDGYRDLRPRAGEIKRAARSGTLLWTHERLTTTDASCIDARPSAHRCYCPDDGGQCVHVTNDHAREAAQSGGRAPFAYAF